jgi:hypothetical protein
VILQPPIQGDERLDDGKDQPDYADRVH